jgi:hypothetical protein
MGNVRGSALLSRFEFLAGRFGPEARARVLAEVSETTRAALSGKVDSRAWLPFDAYIDFTVTADRLFGAGDLALCRDMGRHNAEVNLPTAYRVFLRMNNPLYVFQKAARVWDVHYDSGRIMAIQDAPRIGRLRILDFDKPHPAHCRLILGWAERAAELAGAKLSVAREEHCRTRGHGFCEILLVWAED